MEAIMRKNVLLFLIITFLITSCSLNQENYSNTYHPLTDYQYMYFMQNKTIPIAATQNGYYILNGKFIYYMDKENMNPVLLDSRPNSTCHSTDKEELEQCSAFVNNDNLREFLAYYNEKLYTIENHIYMDKQLGSNIKPTLIEISPDGSERKVIFTFDFAPQSIAIHRGNLYYSKQDFDIESNSSYQIMSLNLHKTSSKPTSIYNGNLEMGNIIDIIPYGKQIYFNEGGKNMYRTMRYDIEDKTLKQLFTEKDNESAAYSTIFQDKLLFSVFTGDPESKVSSITYSSNLDGSNIEAVPVANTFITNNYADANYLYSRPVWFYTYSDQYPDLEHNMTVYSKQFDKVDTINLSDLPLNHFICGGDDDYMFVQYPKDGNMYTLYLDKRAIGTGEAKFEVLLESPYLYQWNGI